MIDIENDNNLSISYNTLSIYKKDDYVLCVIENNLKQDRVLFSKDRQCLFSLGIDLVNIDEIDQYIGMPITDVWNVLGQPHVDIGSGFFIPGYISSDAYLVNFVTENDIVIKVIKTDLFDSESKCQKDG